MTKHTCQNCGSQAPTVSRGLTGTEILGSVLLVLFTCGLGAPVLLGLPILARRQVCPACKLQR